MISPIFVVCTFIKKCCCVDQIINDVWKACGEYILQKCSFSSSLNWYYFYHFRYGVDLIHFTQNKTNVVHASTKENDIIRYLNVEENNYIRYFRGHNKKVVTLCMNPTDDSFLSGSLDKSIRLWDIRYLFRLCFKANILT